MKSNLKRTCLVITLSSLLAMTLVAFLLGTFFGQSQEKKLEAIQRIIDNATEGQISGVVIKIKGPEINEWIGVSGYSDIENQVPIQQSDVFSLASIGKTYMATAILKLVEDNELILDDKISKYLPKEIIENIPNAKKATIRNLLGHTSGFHNYNKHVELNNLYLTGQLKLDTLSHMNTLRRYGYGASEHTGEFGKYKYSSTNYLLLSMIADSVLTQGHAEYIRENIIRKHGFYDTFYKETPSGSLVKHYGDLNQDGKLEDLTAQTVETTNWYSGDDGVYASVDDVSLFMEKLVTGKILKPSTLKEMMTWNNEKDPDYGLGLMADKGFPYKFLMGHSGRGIGITTDVYYFPKQDMYVSILCNTGLRSASPKFKKAYYKMRNKIVKKLFLF